MGGSGPALLEAVVADRERVLGPDHPTTAAAEEVLRITETGRAVAGLC